MPDAEVDVAAERPSRRAVIRRATLIVAVLGALFALFRLLPVGHWIEAFKYWVEGQGAFGFVAFAVVYIAVSLVPGGPAALMTLAAGAVFGFLAGTVVVSVASTTAATLAFLLARTLLKERADRMAARSPTFAGLNRAIESRGMRTVALVRLSPVFPFTIVNYLFGLTPVRPVAYVLGSWVAMLPGSAAYVYFGSALSDAASGASPVQKITRLVLGAAAVVATVLIARFAARAIRAAGIGRSTRIV